VTVTEVRNGTVVVRSSAGIIVRTDDGVKSFTQGDVDKRGVKIVKNGKPVQVSQLHEGDKLSAVIITSMPPKVMTEQEVNATLATARTASAGSAAAPASSASARTAAPASSTARAESTSTSGTASAPAGSARTLPKTASSWPLVGLVSALSLAIGLGMTIRRRSVS
jgi:hypothetical protein